MVKSLEKESRMAVSGSKRVGNGELLFNGDSFSLGR